MSGAEGDPGVPAGQIHAEYRPDLRGGLIVLVDRIVVQTNSATPTTCSFYRGGVEDINLIEYTGSGDIDIADEFQPLYLPAASKLIAVWEGASAGAAGVARLQIRVARVSGGSY